jgi:hypothetical protein
MASLEELESQNETLKRRLAEVELENAGLKRQHERDVLAQHITAVAHDAGIHGSAIPYVVERAVASGEWKLNSKDELYRVENGVPVVDHATGDYISPLRWMKQSLRKDAPHLFVDPEQAAGSPGSTAGVRNPWLPQFWSMTEQGNLYRKDKAMAEKLAAEAGSRVGASRPSR